MMARQRKQPAEQPAETEPVPEVVQRKEHRTPLVEAAAKPKVVRPVIDEEARLRRRVGDNLR